MTEEDGSGTPYWLSPTRAWHLYQCPASVVPLGSEPLANEVVLQNSGIIAHASIQRWIERSAFVSDDPRTQLARDIAAVMPDIAVLPADWTITRARLLARADELAELLRSQGDARAQCEIELRDPDLGIRGKPDVVLIGKATGLIDLKSQVLKGRDLPPWVTFQLAVYAHLVEKVYGAFPATVDVFSLNRGRIPVVLSPSDIAHALSVVAGARAMDPTATRPALATCRFCRRRLECGPHWAAAPTWPERDCVEGAVELVEFATNGTIALKIAGLDGDEWVSGVPSHVLVPPIGSRVRIARVYQPDCQGTGSSGWRWGSRSIIAVTPRDSWLL